MGMHDGFDHLSKLFPILFLIFIIIFGVIIGLFVATLARGASRRRKDDRSPVLSVEAAVVTKRADVSSRGRMGSGNDGMRHMTSSTTYFVTFEVESGDRMELEIPRDEYGMLVEGDKGKLTFQGARYLRFERTR